MTSIDMVTRCHYNENCFFFRSIDDNLSPFETGLKKADGKNREWSLEASAESAMKIKEDEGRGNNAYRTVSPFAGGKTAGYSGGGCFGVCRVPYEKVSINQIIHNADISRGSFYTYFVDKKDLLEYILSDVI